MALLIIVNLQTILDTTMDSMPYGHLGQNSATRR